MAPITLVTGRGLPLRGADLDTDRIMPWTMLSSLTLQMPRKVASSATVAAT